VGIIYGGESVVVSSWAVKPELPCPPAEVEVSMVINYGSASDYMTRSFSGHFSLSLSE
jgi:hypothetical protein